MADKKESLHDVDQKPEGLHESHEPTHSDGLHEHEHDHGHDNKSEENAKHVAKKTEKENEEEADAEEDPVNRHLFHHGAGVPNDYPGGNPGNADNDRMHQAHAERGGHGKDESDEEFLAKPHHVLPKNASGISDDEDVDLIGEAVHGPNDTSPASHHEEDDKEEEDKK